MELFFGYQDDYWLWSLPQKKSFYHDREVSSFHALYDVQFSERFLCIVQVSRFFVIFCNDKLLSNAKYMVTFILTSVRF
jgi:hypothetical protein